MKVRKRISPKNAKFELKVWSEDRTYYYYVIRDDKGNEMILTRGDEYLEFKIAQQKFFTKNK